jgi:crotonobetaine/carnitine-CoA ligase
MAADLRITGDRTLNSVLQEGATLHPDRTLVVFEDEQGTVSELSWAEVQTRSRGVAAQLASHGVRRGDRVQVHLENRPEFLLAWFGLAELGASMVPTNPAAPALELEYLLDHAQVVAAITDAGRETVVRAASRARRDQLPVLYCEDFASTPGSRSLTAPPVAATEELSILYTSGTTSHPKGVRITHANYVWAGEVYASAMRLRPEDRVLTALPLFHANSQYYSTMGALVSGATLVLVNRFSASKWVDQAIRHRASVANLFAAAIRMILAQDPRPEWQGHSLRAVMFAQNLLEEEWLAWHERVGAPLIQGYGMTETIGPPLMTSLAGAGRRDTVGRPTLGYTCRLTREDGSVPCVGEPGELLVAGVPGETLMAGYLHDREATEAILSDGWLRTGDVFSIEPDGSFAFVDRRKDLIKRAGENVAASEVEAVLRSHPHVIDAAVVGIPDPMRDENILAFVVGAGVTEDELISWCRERLSKFRVPGHVSLVDGLPRTPVGKVQKHVLRQQWLAAQGTAGSAS